MLPALTYTPNHPLTHKPPYMTTPTQFIESPPPLPPHPLTCTACHRIPTTATSSPTHMYCTACTCTAPTHMHCMHTTNDTGQSILYKRLKYASLYKLEDMMHKWSRHTMMLTRLYLYLAYYTLVRHTNTTVQCVYSYIFFSADHQYANSAKPAAARFV
jgi:hypothetical protein